MNRKLLFSCLIGVSVLSAKADLTFHYRYDDSKLTAVLTGSTGTPDNPKVNVPLKISKGTSTLYTVTAIEAHAIDNISGLETLVIPNTVNRIGTVNSPTDKISEGADISNFLNCPDLKKIEVSDGNTVFKSTGAGILTSADGKQVYRIPPKVDVSQNNGTLKMATTGVAIGRNAFEGNSTVKKITFSKNLEYISSQPGFSTMTALAEFEILTGGSAEEKYMVHKGALILKSSKTLLHYPPAAPAATYTLAPSYVEIIGAKAFENTVSLKELIVPEGVKTMKNYAFLNSSVTKVTLPSTFNFLTTEGKGAFMNSKIITLIWDNGKETEIPRDFMLGCKNLKSFICSTPPHSIGSSAFRDCTSLQTFSPFDGNSIASGDSIWANTGFTEVIFDRSERTSEFRRDFKSLFAGCKNLKKLDLSAYYLPTSNHRVYLCSGFASDCPALEEVDLPGFIGFEEGCFSGSENIRHLQVCQFESSATPVICFNSNSKVSPECYVLVPENGAGYFSTPVKNLFGNTGDGQLRPVFYFETVYPLLDTLAPGSINYVPGATLKRYPLPSDGAEIEELFEFRLRDEEYYIDMTLNPKDFVKINRVVIDDRHEVEIPSSGLIQLKPEFRTMKNMNIYFEVNGVPMSALYPSNLLPWDRTTGVHEISSTGSIDYTLNGKTLTIPEGAQAEVYDLQGILRVASDSVTTDLSHLSGGIYILRLTTDLHYSSVRIYIP